MTQEQKSLFEAIQARINGEWDNEQLTHHLPELFTLKEDLNVLLKKLQRQAAGYPRFPNGFTNWYETHHEVVSFITTQEMGEADETSAIFERGKEQGHGGLYELAEEWTNEFEELHKGRQWDGEFFDEIEAFLFSKNNKQSCK